MGEAEQASAVELYAKYLRIDNYSVDDPESQSWVAFAAEAEELMKEQDPKKKSADRDSDTEN